MASIEIKSDDWIDLDKARQLTPSRPCRATLCRWAREGLTCRDGTTIRLQHAQFGARIRTKSMWLDEFFTAVRTAGGVQIGRRKRPAKRAKRGDRHVANHGDAKQVMEEAGL